MEDIQVIEELKDRLEKFEARYNSKFNDVQDILDQLSSSKKEQEENTKSQE
jgi:nitrate reductase assembly molybdenum cofactor insertion protein NarJ